MKLSAQPSMFARALLLERRSFKAFSAFMGLRLKRPWRSAFRSFLLGGLGGIARTRPTESSLAKAAVGLKRYLDVIDILSER
jgi:hypothetical protein